MLMARSLELFAENASAALEGNQSPRPNFIGVQAGMKCNSGHIASVAMRFGRLHVLLNRIVTLSGGKLAISRIAPLSSGPRRSLQRIEFRPSPRPSAARGQHTQDRKYIQTILLCFCVRFISVELDAVVSADERRVLHHFPR